MSSFQLTKRIIGIDFGGYSLKIAEGLQAGGKITLLNYEVVRLPSGKGPEGDLTLEEQAALLTETLKKMGVKTGNAVSEVSGPWTVARHTYFPDLPDEEMREAIRWGSKADFPFALDEALIDFLKLDVLTKEAGESEAEIVAAAAGRGVVERRLDLLRSSGLRPLFISLPAFSLMQAYRFTQPVPWKETAVILDLGCKKTHIVILKEGKLKFSREIAVAGDFFTQALTGTFEVHGREVVIEEETAEKIKLSAALKPETESPQLLFGVPLDLVQNRLTSVADRLLLEVERSLNYYKNQFKDYNIARILMAGGGSQLKGLGPYLEKNLEIPVRCFEGTGALILKKKINQELLARNLPLLIPVLGLITQDKPFINLSAQLAPTRLPRLSPKALLKPTLAALLPLGVIFFFASQYLSAAREVTRLRMDLASKKVQMARIGGPMEQIQRLKQEETALDRTLEGYPKFRISYPPLKELLQDLPNLIPSHIMLTRLQVRQWQEQAPSPQTEAQPPMAEQSGGLPSGGPPVSSWATPALIETAVEIQGTVFGGDAEILQSLAQFVNNIKSSRWVKEAKLQSTKKNNDYSTNAADFVIQGRLQRD